MPGASNRPVLPRPLPLFLFRLRRSLAVHARFWSRLPFVIMAAVAAALLGLIGAVSGEAPAARGYSGAVYLVPLPGAPSPSVVTSLVPVEVGAVLLVDLPLSGGVGESVLQASPVVERDLLGAPQGAENGTAQGELKTPPLTVEDRALAVNTLAPAAGGVEPLIAVPPATMQPPGDGADDGLPAWRRYAVAAPESEGRAMIAIVIDDLGHDARRAARAIALDPLITLAFLPYTLGVERNVWLARRVGHEVLVHLPMEADDPAEDPGPRALLLGLERDEMLRRLYWQLTRFDEYVGVNNHMGSKFTADSEAMATLMDEIKRRGLLFLDSFTTTDSVGAQLARAFEVPYARRDVFLDNVMSAEAIAVQLEILESIAARQGVAVGIAHPRDETFGVLETWLGNLEERGYVLVPLSAVAALSGPGQRALAANAAISATTR